MPGFEKFMIFEVGLILVMVFKVNNDTIHVPVETYMCASIPIRVCVKTLTCVCKSLHVSLLL